MKNNDRLIEFCPESPLWSPLEEIAREGAKKMLAAALEQEVNEFLNKYSGLKDDSGKQVVVRNGYSPAREIMTGIGNLEVKQPRVDDRKIRTDKKESVFSSKILPKYHRRIPSIDNLLPVLYLKGISTSDFPVAFEAILGKNAKNLSSNVIVGLKAKWKEEYEAWSKRDLSKKDYVYFWVDGIHFNVRLEDERTCILVIVAADSTGKKELLAVSDGYRESKISWKDVLLNLKERGLKSVPKLAIGDGALGFWAALPEVFAETKQQRCWVHKTANILDKMPKSIQPKAKSAIHEMYMAETKDKALKTYEHFINVYSDKYPKAVECLTKDKDRLFTFYDFPAAHWRHIRSTNPIESTFATVRLRTAKTKGCGSRVATLTMVWKLGIEAEKTWIKLHGHQALIYVIEGKRFIDGILKNDDNNAQALVA
jgi:transposase-like protein